VLPWTIPPLARRLALPAALLAVAAAYLGTLRFGFVADAGFLIADNRLLDSWAHLGETLVRDYFWSSSGASIPYWRPFTKLSWLVEARLFGRGPEPFHAVQLAWLLVAVAGVAELARRLGATREWAAAAALAFGLHPALVEPGCLLMARSDVVVLAAILWSAIGWRAWRDGSPRWAALHVVALAVALGSKEIAVVVPLALAVWALADGKRRFATLAPSFALVAIYWIVRARLVPPPRLEPDALRLFASVGAYGAASIPFRLASGLHNLSLAEAHAPSTLAIAAAVWLALAGGASFALRKRNAPALFLLALGLGTLLPVVVGPAPSVPGAIGKFAIADRWAIGAAACASIGLGLVAARVSPGVQKLIGALLALWAIAALVIAPGRHADYASDESLLALEEQEFRDTPPAWRTQEDLCRARERSIAQAIAAHDDGRALAAIQAPSNCPDDDGTRFNLFSILMRQRRFAEARAIGEPLWAHFTLDRRWHGPLAALLGTARLNGGDFAGAEPLLHAALDEGAGSCATFVGLAKCADAQGRADEARTWHDRASACAAHSRWH